MIFGLELSELLLLLCAVSSAFQVIFGVLTNRGDSISSGSRQLMKLQNSILKTETKRDELVKKFNAITQKETK